MSALGFLQVPVNLLMQREEGDLDRHYFEHAGIACPYRIIDPRGYLGGALEMIEVLKRGEVLSVMGDRMLGSDRNAVAVDFFGAPVRFPFSAYKLASVTGAPVAVVLSAKTGAASYALQLVRGDPGAARPGARQRRLRPLCRPLCRGPGALLRRAPLPVLQFFRYVAGGNATSGPFHARSRPMTVKEKLKKILVEELNLEDLTPADIDDDAPLFGEGLGLDSLDAVELVVLVQKHFGVEIKDMEEGRPALQSVNSLAGFIEAKRAA